MLVHWVLDLAATDIRSVGTEKKGNERRSGHLMSSVLQKARASIAAFLLPLGFSFSIANDQ